MQGVSIFDAGTIAGTGGTAIEFNGSGNTLTLGAGYNIEGIVDPLSGSNTLQLGGSGAASFDLTDVGTTYIGFTALEVIGGTWTLSGSGSGWSVDSGGTAEVASGADLSASTVDAGGVLIVKSGGTVSNTTVSSGGTLDVLSGGLADPTTIYSGGTEIVSAGGTDFGAQISGGTQLDYGVASGATVFAGSQVVESGGTASSTTVDQRRHRDRQRWRHRFWRADLRRHAA